MTNDITEIKIVSNPYEKRITYSVLNGENWAAVENYSSKLMSDKYKTGFFPFIVYDVIEILLDEYGDNPISLTFEGTTDEYDELKNVISKTGNSAITLNPLDTLLCNARDIISDINEEYQSIRMYIDEFNSYDGKIKETERQFNDVSKKEIPICVVGNVSAGKSTFINALIGHDILASSNEPTTAKVFRIEDNSSASAQTILIDFSVANLTEPCKIRICDGRPTEIIGLSVEDALYDKLTAECAVKSMWEQAKIALGLLNDSADVKPLVRISIPFYHNSPFGKKRGEKFVIFDTPGSNSASNKDHEKILMDQMKKMSNGLLIFVAKKETLDTKENAELCSSLTKEKYIDPRFTMLVVNQVETVKDVPDDKERIIGQALPQMLKTNRIFYVSSIMGLASKHDYLNLENLFESDDFENDSYAETYECYSRWFDGSKDGTGKSKKCFLLNIMPRQLKDVCVSDAEQERNRMLANSGLYSIESEISLFAEKYSPYNKCFQAKVFFEAVKNMITEIIEEKTVALNAELEELNQSLDESTQDACERIDKEFSDLNDNFSKEYIQAMKQFRKEVSEKIDVKHTAEEMKKSAQDTSDASSIDINNDIISEVKRRCIDKIKEAQELLNAKSEEFWKEKCSLLQNEMITLLSNGNNMLAESTVRRLTSLIKEFRQIEFNSDAVRKMDNNKFIIDSFLFWSLPEKQLDAGKLSRSSNLITQKEINSKFNEIISEHMEIFEEWADSLKQEITNNLAEYSPEIRKKQERISLKKKDIEANARKRSNIIKCSEHIKEMLSKHSIGESPEASDASADTEE